MRQRRAQSGLTTIDVLILIATIVLIALVVPAFFKSQSRAARASCVNSLKCIGMAFRLWSQDNNDNFPWLAPVEKGGAMELVTNGNILPIFLIVTNELNSPGILKCPDDAARSRCVNWSGLSVSNISYFIGLEASEKIPASILSGDRNLSTNRTLRSGLLIVQNPKDINWAPGIHGTAGNVVFGDGSVQQISNTSPSNRFSTNMTLPARFILP